MPATVVRSALRSATADHHQRVDAMFSGADLGQRVGFGLFLSAQAAAFLPTEDALERAGVGDVVSDWAERRRSAKIRDDLDALGLPVPSPAGEISFSGEPAMLGGLYVLEGSRLGGALLKRAVAADLPATFLTPGNSSAWIGLLALLEDRLRTQEHIDMAIDAASRVFALFETSGRHFLEVR